MKNQLIAIEKACFKIEKAIANYNKEAGNCFRQKEVSRAFHSKASALYQKLANQHEQIMKNCWNQNIFY